jgi:chloramphenicol O-acetyltransferase type A
MPRFLDLEQWPRRAAFEFFRGYDNPYFNVCAPLEVTSLVELSRSVENVSFSLAALHLALRAANECEPFRYRLQEEQVLVHDQLHAGTTTLLERERLAFVYYDFHEDFSDFREGAARAREALGHSATVIDARADRTDLIHFSSLPWIAFTSISHARNWKREDSVPKITFGRYHRVGTRIEIPVSVEVHHALLDGVHVGRYFERLQRYLAEPEAALRRSHPKGGDDHP